MNLHERDELNTIVRAMLEQSATDDQQHRLAALLRLPEARQIYLAHMNTQALLEWRFGQTLTGGSFTSTPSGTLRSSHAAGRGTRQRTESRRLRMLVRYAAAAVIVLAFSGMISLLVARAWQARAQHHAGPTVATLVDAERPEWADRETIAVGTALAGRTLELKSGWAEVEMVSGARVRLEGPCELALNAPMHDRLIRGRIVAHVPPPAHGFTLSGPGLAVVDLGTAFTMDVTDSGSTGVRVLTGRVRVNFDENAAPLELTANHELRLTAPNAKPIVTTLPDLGKATAATIRLEGPIDIADPQREFPGVTGERVKLFRESRDVLLTEPLWVSLAVPGRYRDFKQKLVIPAGKRVSSFLMHIAPGTPDIRTYNVAATFDRPVLGVVAVDGLLGRSDAILGRRDIPYPKTDRGLEGALDSRWADEVELSPDRRTVRVRFRSGSGIDELRIIVDTGGDNP